MIEDAELLRRYAEERSEPAFAELVQRHVNVVYAAALRRVGGDAPLAEEVVQTVFTALARKARRLAGHPVLLGWLHRSTRYAASDVLRDKLRRAAREQPLETMNTKTALHPGQGTEVDWDGIRPVIDSLLDRLDERERGALLLRFFEGQSFAQIGATLRLTEDAARMRVARALAKLRVALARRGVVSTSAALGFALANQATAVVPAGLAASVTGAALAGAAVSTGVGLGAVASVGMAFFTMSKIQTGAVAAVILAAAVTGIVELRANRELRGELKDLQAAKERVVAGAEMKPRAEGPGANAAELAATDEAARLRERVALLKARPPGVTDATMKATTACRDVGRATPAAAIETGLWAALNWVGPNGETDPMMQGYVFTPEAKAGLAAFFAQQSEIVRTRYGTPERLLGALWRVQHDEIPAAFQVVQEKRSYKGESDTAEMQLWFRRPTGAEKATKVFLQRGAEGWGILVGPFPEAHWAMLAARIDPATGALKATEAPKAGARP